MINFIEACLLSWFISSLVDIKDGKWLYIFLLAFFNFSIITLSNYMNMYDLFLSTMVIIISTVVSHFFTYNKWSELFLITTFEAVFSSVVVCLTIMVSLLWNHVDIPILTHLLYALGVLFIRKYIKTKRFYLTENVIYKLILILYFTHFVIQQFLQLYLVVKKELPEILITIIMMVLCTIVYIFLFAEISQINKDQEEYKHLKQEKKNEKTLSYLYDQLKITKHDLKHDFDLLNYYIEDNNYEKVKDFIVSKKTMIDSMPTLIQSQNKLLNIIINNKIIQAYAKNIQVESKIIVTETIGIMDYDLNELLSNILDNAIENCLVNGKIYIDIIQDNMFLHIKVINTIDLTNFSSQLITKKNKNDHGFGLKSIHRIVNKYQGTFSVSHNDNSFGIVVTLLNQ